MAVSVPRRLCPPLQDFWTEQILFSGHGSSTSYGDPPSSHPESECPRSNDMAAYDDFSPGFEDYLDSGGLTTFMAPQAHPALSSYNQPPPPPNKPHAADVQEVQMPVETMDDIDLFINTDLWTTALSSSTSTSVPSSGSLPPLQCHDEAAAASRVPPAIVDEHLQDMLQRINIKDIPLKEAIERLGGNDQGLRALMDHILVWAKQRNDFTSIAQSIEYLSMFKHPMAPAWHSNHPCITESNNFYNSNQGVNKRAKIQAAAHTRALRKSRMARQRGHWRAHPAHQNLGDRLGLRTEDRRLHEFELDHAKEKHGFVFLFHKELRPSDVSSLGRMILPKKEAERHLPFLLIREGMMIALEDYDTGKYWNVRYRFWPNNKSRMYVLENMGEFVAYHHLRVGDLILCYRSYQGTFVIRSQKVSDSNGRRTKTEHVKAKRKDNTQVNKGFPMNQRSDKPREPLTTVAPSHQGCDLIYPEDSRLARLGVEIQQHRRLVAPETPSGFEGFCDLAISNMSYSSREFQNSEFHVPLGKLDSHVSVTPLDERLQC